MATHKIHESIEAQGLDDTCLRCWELARAPITLLDKPTLYSLLKRVVQKMEPRSRAEDIAMSHVREVLWGAGRLYEASPELTMQELMR